MSVLKAYKHKQKIKNMSETFQQAYRSQASINSPPFQVWLESMV